MLFRKTPVATAVALVTLALSSSMAAYADTKPHHDDTLDELVVTDSQIKPAPSPTGQLDKAALAAMRARTSDTASLLRSLPAVNLQGAGGVSSLPVINGLAGDRVRTKVDGMDLIASCPNHMNPPLSYIDPTGIESLQVYAGIAPVSLGGDSIAGTIAATTAEPVFATQEQGTVFQGNVGSFYRSQADARGLDVSATMASRRFNVTYTGSTAQSGNYLAGGNFKTYTATGRAKHLLPRDEVASSAYETRNHSLGIAFRTNDHFLEAKLGYQDIPFQNYPNQRMDMTDNEQLRANLRYVGQHEWGALEAGAYRENVDHTMDFGDDKRYWYGAASNVANYGVACAPTGPTCAAGMPMNTESETIGFSVKAEIASQSQRRFRVGADYQQYRLDDWWPPSGGGMWPGTFDNIKDGKRDRSAVFGEWEADLSDRWLATAGVRYERVETDAGVVGGYNSNPMAMGNQSADADAFNQQDRRRSDNNWDLAAVARYTPDANRHIEFGIARKVRSPNLYERYTWSTWSMAAVMNNFVGDGNGYFGDINLDPEQAYTASATIALHHEQSEWELQVTPYYTRVNDYIDAVPGAGFVADQFNVLQYANQSARIYGVDVSGSMKIADTAWGQWGLGGLVNYTNGKNRDTGSGLYNIMPVNAQLTLTHVLGNWNSALEWLAVDGKNKASGVRNEIMTAGYSILNLRAGYTWNSVRFDIGVENLFDRLYDLPLGGVYLGQGRTMAMNPPPSDQMTGWGTAVPGMGRSVFAGIALGF
ncbi:MAG: TonB-dependent receptor [Halioglobus sp.]|nr:TonB-dependent receptor [Halioglobus sp.]